MRLKSKLPALMEKEGIDQKTLAVKTGLSPTTVGKIYRSHFRAIDVHTIEALMMHFGIRSLDELFEVVWDEDSGY